MLAWLPLSATVPPGIGAPLSLKVTVPVGVPAPLVTVAVRVIDWPNVEGFNEEVGVEATGWIFATVNDWSTFGAALWLALPAC